ncbi:hypothetical protein GDO81_004581 [Engystomops pustulosus]|uniref:Uncharacterized protein n=1 Tax=Engystomops pustulosus TaxID=76066 RepID=A0AAV6ZTH0_ENGPU|nr:hypothetical protein GDO81_004581 [Engystomops pustulosus]
MGTVIPIIFLLLVVLGGSWTAADPKSALHRERGEWCTEHQKVHKRLETIEEVRYVAASQTSYSLLTTHKCYCKMGIAIAARSGLLLTGPVYC